MWGFGIGVWGFLNVYVRVLAFKKRPTKAKM
jgi:hypothetical protein